MILDLIEKNKDITQREMSEQLGVAVSQINAYLDEYEEKKLIKRKKYSTKHVEYFVTNKGIEKKKLLNIGYLKYSQILYDQARENIEQFLTQLESKGRRNIFLYGAGEVAEILLHTIYSSDNSKLNVLGVIDDDVGKIGSTIYDIPIVPIGILKDKDHDGVLISSYSNREAIMTKLKKDYYNLNKTFNFFDI
jgi:FlaA1/EpsC-like NDP-sugar epimerase